MVHDQSEAHLDLTLGRETVRDDPVPEKTFRIAVLGDFSGRGSRGVVAADVSGRKAFPIDRDNLEATLTHIAPELSIPMHQGALTSPDDLTSSVSVSMSSHVSGAS